MESRMPPPARTILAAGAIAGVLDILAAFALQATNGVAPHRVLQAIASGLLGPAAYRGGAAAAALGLLLHFVIAGGAAAVFYAASRRWPALVRRALPAGAVFGVLVYAFMNQVVLPLSRVSFRAPAARTVVIMLAIHIACVGLPIALTVRRLAGPAARR
jgi:hypothetical protein